MTIHDLSLPYLQDLSDPQAGVYTGGRCHADTCPSHETSLDTFPHELFDRRRIVQLGEGLALWYRYIQDCAKRLPSVSDIIEEQSLLGYNPLQVFHVSVPGDA